jgi:hypothetical protein
VSIKIKNPRRNKLYNDGEKKECGRCHKIKPYEYFRKRQGRLHSVCEKCRQIIQGINNYKKQIKVITTLYEKQCHNCHTGLQFLPAMQFHHLDPSSKNYTWKTLGARNIDEIIRIMREENLHVLCKNCHSCEEITNFDEFKDIILSEKISITNTGEIDEVIYNEIRRNIKHRSVYRKGTQHRARIKYRIKKWVKKRIVIEYLYSGVCIGCRDVKINDKLSALEFHHRNPKKKEFKWEHLSKYPIDKIINILKNEDCICLCKNCHSLVHSIIFEQFYNEIFENDISTINLVEEKYFVLKDNINNYSFKEEL